MRILGILQSKPHVKRFMLFKMIRLDKIEIKFRNLNYKFFPITRWNVPTTTKNILDDFMINKTRSFGLIYNQSFNISDVII